MLPRLFDTLAGIEACTTSAVQLQWPDPLAQAVLNHLDAVALSSVQLRQHPLQATGFDLPEEDTTTGLNDACPAPRDCTVPSVRWEALLEDCLTPSIATNTSPYEWGSRGLPKLVVLTTFSIFPPRHGGQARVFHLYRQLARWFDITIVSTTQAGHATREQLIAPGLREIRVSKSRKHQQQELALRRALGVPIEDVAMLGFWQDSPELIDTIREACADAWRVITCHPYHYPLLREHIKTPFWYEAQDVETQIKTAILPQGERSRPWLEKEKVAAAEAACCAEAEYVLTCSPEDALELQRRYQLTADKCVMVPNGGPQRNGRGGDRLCPPRTAAPAAPAPVRSPPAFTAGAVHGQRAPPQSGGSPASIRIRGCVQRHAVPDHGKLLRRIQPRHETGKRGFPRRIIRIGAAGRTRNGRHRNQPDAYRLGYQSQDDRLPRGRHSHTSSWPAFPP